MMSRKYSIVVFGATGFTGSLAAHYLAKKLSENASSEDAFIKSSTQIAIAGRNDSKLSKLQSELVEKYAQKFDIVIADSFDKDAIEAMVKSTRVVLSTTGPFAKYGSLLVESCAKNGTHYVDTTGESAWVIKMIQKFHSIAEESGAVIVPGCAFESIPSDIGAFAVADYLRRKYNGEAELKKIDMSLDFFFYPSAGTMLSAVSLAEEFLTKKNVCSFKEFLDPYAECLRDDPVHSPGSKIDPADFPSLLPKFSKALKVYNGFSITSSSNEVVVRRTQSLFRKIKSDYDCNFTYREYASQKTLIRVLIQTFVFFLIAVISVFLVFKPIREFVKRILPESGYGPDKETREKGYFAAHHVGTFKLKKNRDEKTVVVTMSGGEPGYNETAKMVAESALTLANPQYACSIKGGLLTPGFALGIPLVRRLQNAGLNFVEREL
jgi:short subunit dehydrogenase-like uncharacterized protein